MADFCRYFRYGVPTLGSVLIVAGVSELFAGQVTWPFLIPALVVFLLSLTLSLSGPHEYIMQQGAGWLAGHRLELAIAKATLIFVAVLAGIVLASGNRRKTDSSGFISAIVILVVYYIIQSTILALGKHSGMPQVLVIWLPVAVTGIPAHIIWLRGGWR